MTASTQKGAVRRYLNGDHRVARAELVGWMATNPLTEPGPVQGNQEMLSLLKGQYLDAGSHER